MRGWLKRDSSKDRGEASKSVRKKTQGDNCYIEFVARCMGGGGEVLRPKSLNSLGFSPTFT